MRELLSRLQEAELEEVDPAVHELIDIEAERQARRIILIPSESMSPLAVRQALGSVFQNIYAEGYPNRRMMRASEEELLDYSQRLAHFRRYSDRRLYKGTEFADFIECLAQRRAAQCFATDEVPPEQIYVNVQPLSGAAANLAVYDALLDPGDTIMGMDLPSGGHLTHGSPFNISGRRYQPASYQISRRTGRLDYDRIREMAREHRPRIIIAGYTSYPWSPNWEAFRSICDDVGALLMADIAHTAGMIVGSAHPSPVGIADVMTFTTHKTLCGPRGAVVLTTDPQIAARVEAAVFPGAQGGPHVQKFAAMAVAFYIAKSRQFHDLQQQIVRNATCLASALESEGLTLAYGGTDTHLLVVDLRAIETPSGFPIMGEIAARVLDLCGIVCNKNTIPGDTSAADARGIRLGTPWITQRSITEGQIGRLAGIITRVLTSIHAFTYEGISGDLPRGKLDLDVLESARREVGELAGELTGGRSTRRGYPFHFYQELAPSNRHSAALQSYERLDDDSGIEATSQRFAGSGGHPPMDRDTFLLHPTGGGVLLVRGPGRARAFLNEALTADVAGLEPGMSTRSLLLGKEGLVIDDVVVVRPKGGSHDEERYLLVTHSASHPRVKAWLRGLADGYVLFDSDDLFRKVQGPAVVEDLSEGLVEERLIPFALWRPGGAKAEPVQFQPGPSQLLGQEAPPVGSTTDALIGGAEVLVARLGAMDFLCLVSPACSAKVCTELLKNGAVLADHTEWDARRREEGFSPIEQGTPTGARLYRLGHTDLFHLNKTYFVGQRNLESFRSKAQHPEFCWEQSGREDESLRHTRLCESHRRLGARMIAFAGWEMPVWYTSVLEEHQAVRTAAALFDVAHMGVFEIAGPSATDFLDAVTTNYVRWMDDGQSQYGYLLDPDGRVLDDARLYRLSPERYLMVVNAVNEDKDWAWLTAVNNGRALIDRERCDLFLERPAVLRDLKDPAADHDQLVDLALQGPRSLDVLQCLSEDPALRRRLRLLQRSELLEATLSGMDLILARTGYTGEEFGYELFVHPDELVSLWGLLLDRGRPLGIKPAGLGARDSVRTEAGLPLYGQELAGPLSVTPTEAGFGSYVKYHKPFFVGRDPYLARNLETGRAVVRFRVAKKGQRKVHSGDPVVTHQGQVIGTVTSCSLDGDGYQLGLAVVGSRYQSKGLSIGVFPLAARRAPGERAKHELRAGDRVLLHVEATVLSRFPGREA